MHSRAVTAWPHYWYFLFIVFSLFFSSDLYAGEVEEKTILKKSLDALEAGQYPQALETLRKIPGDSKNMPVAAYIAGASFNRIGNFERAVNALMVAKRSGLKTDNLDLELGWAELETGRLKSAIVFLTLFLEKHPEHAKANELLGRSLLRYGRLEEGVALLKKAKQLDPSLADTVHTEFAYAAYALGDDKYAVSQLQAASTIVPDSPVGNYLQERFGESANVPKQAQQKDRTWYGLQTYAGYNDNVLGNAKGEPLPAGIVDEASPLFHLGGHVGHRRVLSSRSDIYGVFALGADHYFDLSELDSITARGNGRYRYRLDNDVVVSLGGTIDTLYVDGKKLRAYWDVLTAAGYTLSKDQAVDATLSYGSYDYDLENVFEVRDRDGDALTLSGRFSQRFAEDFAGRVGLSLQTYDAKGDDFDNDSWSVYFDVEKSYSINTDSGKNYTPVLTATLSYTGADYEHLNTFAGVNGSEYKRKDDRWLASLGVNVPVKKNISVFAQYQYQDNQSNVTIFDFDQNLFNVGLILQY